MINLQSLKYFVEVVRYGSIRQAAEWNHIAPSALSRQIQRLERYFGSPLIERLPTGVRPTPAGEILLRQTAGFFREIDHVRTLVDDLRGLRRGQISIWTIEGVVGELLAPTIARFADRYPDITFNVTITDSLSIQMALARDEADIGLTFNSVSRPDIEVLQTLRMPQHAILPPHHRHAARSSLILRELDGEIIAIQEKGFGIRNLVEKAATRDKLSFRRVVTTNSIEMSKSLVRTGAAITFLHTAAVWPECKAGVLRAIPLEDDILSRGEMELSVHRDRVGSYAALAFIKELQETLQTWKGRI